jgi:hypothetical protein
MNVNAECSPNNSNGAGGYMTGWTLERSNIKTDKWGGGARRRRRGGNGGSNPNAISIKSTCCGGGGGQCRAGTTTTCNDNGGNELIFLDRHKVECSDAAYPKMSRWYLKKCNGGYGTDGGIKILVTCCAP